MNRIIGVKDGKYITVSDKEIIHNALQQEKEGIEPHFAWHDNGKPTTKKGWLIWSSYKYGCGVVYRRDDGKMIILSGTQGDFCYC